MKDIMDEIATSSFIKKRENVFSVDVKEEDWWSGSVCLFQSEHISVAAMLICVFLFSFQSGYTKWSLFGALLVIILAWLIGGHLHAKRRLRKGRPLMAYHRVRYYPFLIIVCSFIFKEAAHFSFMYTSLTFY